MTHVRGVERKGARAAATGAAADSVRRLTPTTMMESPEAEQVTLALRQLAANPTPNDDPASAHIRAGALFARLKALNRDANTAARAHKQITADARHDMDQTHLRLQNLLYEKRHLEREIEKCRQFAYVLNFVPSPVVPPPPPTQPLTHQGLL